MTDKKTGNKLFTTATKTELGGVNFDVGPCVVEVRLKGGKRERRVVFGVNLAPPGRAGDIALALTRDDGSMSVYQLEKPDDVKVAEDKSSIRFSAYGNTYTIRAIRDKDIDWALGRSDKIKKPKTAEELKRVLMQNRTLWIQT